MLYRIFSSLKTSVYILCFICLVFLIGTVFPQGEDIDKYIKAGGKYVAVVRVFDFLDIFVSPLFVFITIILLINLAVCLYDRLKIFLKIKRKPIGFERLKTHPNVITSEKADIEERLKKIGFKLKAEAQDAGFPQVVIYEKGLQYWWLSWFYHVGIILAVIGFFLTALSAFEKEVTLYPGKPITISLYSKETRWNKFLKEMGREISEERKEDEYTFTLKEFKTDYYQGLKIDYPKNKLARLALGIGIKRIEPSKEGFSYMPKMWLTSLDVKKPDGRVLDAKLWVNKPFRTGALTLYQMGYEQKTKVSVNGEILEVENRVPFQVKGIEGKFVLGQLKLGTLFKKDGTKEKINPVTTVYYISDKNPYETEAIGEISLSKSLNVRGLIFEFKDYEEASSLSYRKDPGVWLVGLASLFVFLGLSVRSFGAWYRVQYAVEDRTAYILISTRGILADKDRIIKKILAPNFA
ncbi:MAG: cytochrome c biogenesis protein ResB [Thermodesulfovibrionia bacterium]|nr:cytochrome c biogenesis protein ResB [Thermodesulfovibrionia bacterium]